MSPAAGKSVIRIGTRRSRLAMAQAESVAGAIRALGAGAEAELVPIVTSGDRMAGRLRDVGGKGLFTVELERALRAGDVDIAVHSAKDVPVAMADDLAIVAVPARLDPRDGLVSRDGWSLAGLPASARVGTGSPRRAAQLREARADLEIVPIRGNVDTRLRKALGADRRLDAVVLAMAGLIRSGLAETHANNICPLAAADFVPAAGQGALAVQALADNEDIARLLSPINDADSLRAVMAERSVLKALGADCRSCIGVYVRPEVGRWRGSLVLGRAEGVGPARMQAEGNTPERVAEGLIEAARGRDEA